MHFVEVGETSTRSIRGNKHEQDHFGAASRNAGSSLKFGNIIGAGRSERPMGLCIRAMANLRTAAVLPLEAV